jgi:hypothetical protein
MTIVTEIRVAELKYDNIKKDNEDLILKLECCEREYEEHLKIMNLEFNTQKTNYEAIIDNLEMELDTIRKELEFSKVILHFKIHCFKRIIKLQGISRE